MYSTGYAGGIFFRRKMSAVTDLYAGDMRTTAVFKSFGISGEIAGFLVSPEI